jgi:hypothetical protein
MTMTSSTNPAPVPERLPAPPDSQTPPRPNWPRPEKKTVRFPIKIATYIPG